MPRNERVPVRWGFVLVTGAVVFAVLGVALYYGWGPLSSDAAMRKEAIGVVNRALGH
jgi:hypothetical protein